MADLLSRKADIPPDFAEMVEQLSIAGVDAVLFTFVVMLVLWVVFSTRVGLLGGITFKRDRPVPHDSP